MHNNSLIHNSLPANSKVWVYQSTRAFSPAEATAVTERIYQFVKNWTAHKLQVAGDGALLYNRFVVLMADTTEVEVSGCSIDSSVHFIRSLAEEFKADFFDRWNMAYELNAEVLSCKREEFEKLVAEGIVTDDTPVFNNLIQTKAEFVSKWRVPFKNSWHKNLSPLAGAFTGLL